MEPSKSDDHLHKGGNNMPKNDNAQSLRLVDSIRKHAGDALAKFCKYKPKNLVDVPPQWHYNKPDK